MSSSMMIKAWFALFLGCLIATTALTPVVMWFARKVGAIDEGGYRKVFKGSMPLLGGLAIALPLILLGVGAGLAGHLVINNWKWLYINHNEYWGMLMSFAGSRRDSIILAIGGVAVITLGLYDDIKGMRARWKLVGQLVVALFVCYSGYTLTSVALPLTGSVYLGATFGGVVTVLWIVGLINAFNLIDGVDGLASGIALTGAAALVALSIVQENLYVLFAGAAFTGSLFAFLLYNFPPAKIFLGDTGSMFLGYILAMMSLIGSQKAETSVIILGPMLALGIPIFETLISIVRRYIRGVPVFAGDNHHTHHRLLLKGYSQPRIVLTLCGTGVLLAAAAVMSAMLPDEPHFAWMPFVLYAGTLGFIAWLAGYLQPTTFRATIDRRNRNKIYQALGQYATLRLNANGLSYETDLLLELCRHELGLSRIEVQLKDGPRLMASPNGTSQREPTRVPEQLLVKSSDGQDLLVYYEFSHTPDKHKRQDVSLCLAGIFDQLKVGAKCPPTEESR